MIYCSIALLHQFNVLLCSEYTAEGRRITKLDQILLNGNNIAIVRILIDNAYIKYFRYCLMLVAIV